MKKTSTHSFVFGICFLAFAGCSKEVKTPVNKTSIKTAAANTYTTTQTPDQSTHSCGGSHTGNSGNGY